MSRANILPASLLLLVGAAFLWSGIGPKDRLTWGLEVFPVVIGAAILIPTYTRFRLTTLLYVLLAIHAVILVVGGHYTYAEVPLFNWIRDAADLSRNHYDRVGHFAQGFVPAILTRELLVRHGVVRGRGWLFFLVVSVCLGFSALYELLEWSVAELSGTAAEAFLGTQGDDWDTQKDMALALVGSILAQLTVVGLHDRQIAALSDSKE
jgi:putative membrane protein